MRRISLATVFLAVLLMGPSALAQSVDIEIQIDTVATESGVLATELVPAGLQGATCSVTATAENQSSVHPDSNLIVRSGTDSITLLDVEREPGAVTTTTETLTLGSEITISLEIGPDNIFSGGITLTAECEAASSPSPSPSPSPTSTGTPSPTPTETPTGSPSPTVEPTVTQTTTPTDTPPPPTVEPSTVTPVTPVETPPGGLAFTGPGAWPLFAIGSAVLLLVGLALLRAGYKRDRAS